MYTGNIHKTPHSPALAPSDFACINLWVLSVFCFKVALNFQTPGCEMDLNDGRFLQNGCCGYVLKPRFLCNGQSTFQPEAPLQGSSHKSIMMMIKVLGSMQRGLWVQQGWVGVGVGMRMETGALDCCRGAVEAGGTGAL